MMRSGLWKSGRSWGKYNKFPRFQVPEGKQKHSGKRGWDLEKQVWQLSWGTCPQAGRSPGAGFSWSSDSRRGRRSFVTIFHLKSQKLRRPSKPARMWEFSLCSHGLDDGSSFGLPRWWLSWTAAPFRCRWKWTSATTISLSTNWPFSIPLPPYLFMFR